MFANVGIAETYLKSTGIDILVANEINEIRAKFYNHLYPDCNMIVGDITDRKIQQKVLEESKKLNIDFVIATPPCQGMSLAGTMDPLDKRNQLIYYAIKIIKELKPKYILLENVPQALKTKIKIDNEYLFTLLKDAMIARDMPGMADIDASMFAFCKAIKENGFKVCLSGECSDEIFGGYPWFYKEHLINHIGFPWALSENLRSNIIRPGILKDNEIQEYVLNARNETLKPVTAIDPNDTYENRYRNINYLTIKWFMNTLVERTDRTSMANSLEVRVPFADYRIFEYVYNLPAKMKLGLNHSDTPIEKYLLREAFKNDIPREVLYRKKSPFPKTYDPHYLNLVETEMLNILNNKKSKINNFINIDFIKDLIYSHGESLKENWFGQLMTYPQTLAYLIQINMWLETYNIESEI